MPISENDVTARFQGGWNTKFLDLDDVDVMDVYVLLYLMRSNILVWVFVGLFLLAAQAQEDPTLLTYFVEYEEDQDDDFIEVGLHI